MQKWRSSQGRADSFNWALTISGRVVAPGTDRMEQAEGDPTRRILFFVVGLVTRVSKETGMVETATVLIDEVHWKDCLREPGGRIESQCVW